MHDECLSVKGWSVADKVAPIVHECKAVLAGGTALALHLGHRESVDFDFFTNETFSVDEVTYSLTQAGLLLKTLDKGEKHIVATLDGVKFSLFAYPYPFVTPSIPYRGLLVASIVEIAAMKVVAISQRGTKRDFIDLYFILQQVPMLNIAQVMIEKYGKDSVNGIHIGKSLVYFADADSDYEPAYLPGKEVKWEKVKLFFRSNVKSLVSYFP